MNKAVPVNAVIAYGEAILMSMETASPYGPPVGDVEMLIGTRVHFHNICKSVLYTIL